MTPEAALERAILRVIDAEKRARKPMVSPARLVTGVRARLKPPPAKADVLRVVDSLVERQVLARFGAGSLHRHRVPRATPRADERVRKFTHRCLFPFAKPTTLADLRSALEKRFEVVEHTRTRLSFRWGAKGPVLSLSQCSVEELGRSVKAQRVVAAATGCAVVSFADLDEVLDEINTLIEAQAVLQAVTQRPYFLVWNGKRVDP